MKKAAKMYLDQGQIPVERIARDYTNTHSITAADMGNLFKYGYEFSFKAIVAEKFGSVRKDYHTHSLPVLAASIGVATHLPREVQAGMAAIEGWEMPYPDRPVFKTWINSGTPAQCEVVLEGVQRLRSFIVKDVLTSSSSILPVLFSKP